MAWFKDALSRYNLISLNDSPALRSLCDKAVRLWRKSAGIRLNLVAILVLLHLVAIMLRAIPVPGYSAMSRSAWKDITVQREISAWHQRIEKLGVSWSHDEFEEFLWRLTVNVMGTREKALAPFNWYYEYFGTSQSWKMFVAPQTHPSRFFVRIFEQNQWRTIFEERSLEFTWRAKQFNHSMMRYAVFFFSWPHYSRYDYADFSDWVFRNVKADFPRAEKAEIVYFGFDSRSPESARAHDPISGEWHSRLTREFQ